MTPKQGINILIYKIMKHMIQKLIGKTIRKTDNKNIDSDAKTIPPYHGIQYIESGIIYADRLFPSLLDSIFREIKRNANKKIGIEYFLPRPYDGPIGEDNMMELHYTIDNHFKLMFNQMMFKTRIRYGLGNLLWLDLHVTNRYQVIKELSKNIHTTWIRDQGSGTEIKMSELIIEKDQIFIYDQQSVERFPDDIPYTITNNGIMIIELNFLEPLRNSRKSSHIINNNGSIINRSRIFVREITNNGFMHNHNLVDCRTYINHGVMVDDGYFDNLEIFRNESIYVNLNQ